MQAAIPDPAAPATFALCKLDPDDWVDSRGSGDSGDSGRTSVPTGAGRPRHQPQAAALTLHRDLLRLRREDPVFRLQGAAGIDGAVLGPAALVLRWFAPPPGESGGAGGNSTGDRLLLINLGADLELDPAPEPLLAPPAGGRWQVLWSSEDPRYGGAGAPPPEDAAGGWRLPGQAAVALAPAPREPCRESDERDERDQRGDARDGKIPGGRE